MKDKERLINKAMELFLRYGVKSVSMDDISRELGVSKKTLYALVENKQDLVKQVVHTHLRCEKKMMREIHNKAGDAIEEMLSIARYIIRMFENMSDATLYDLRKYYRKIWNEWEQFHKAHVFETISKNLRDGVDQGLYRGDMDPDIIARLYVVKSTAIVDDELFPTEKFRKNELFKQYLHYHMRGILSEQGYRLYERYFKELLKEEA